MHHSAGEDPLPAPRFGSAALVRLALKSKAHLRSMCRTPTDTKFESSSGPMPSPSSICISLCSVDAAPRRPVIRHGDGRYELLIPLTFVKWGACTPPFSRFFTNIWWISMGVLPPGNRKGAPPGPPGPQSNDRPGPGRTRMRPTSHSRFTSTRFAP